MSLLLFIQQTLHAAQKKNSARLCLGHALLLPSGSSQLRGRKQDPNPREVRKHGQEWRGAGPSWMEGQVT